jgi:hypothetical protein
MPDNSRRLAVNSQAKPLTETELEAYEARRDLGAELSQAIREMKAGQGRVVYPKTSADQPAEIVGHEYMPDLPSLFD